jgi:hypothetical protein
MHDEVATSVRRAAELRAVEALGKRRLGDSERARRGAFEEHAAQCDWARAFGGRSALRYADER